MFSWSFKRQLLYLALPLFLTLSLFGLVFFKYLYVAPSCTDGVKNGDETGLDCGGSCQLLCTADFLPPIVHWSESFNVLGSIWNAGAYVENPNTTSEIQRASYVFSLYDDTSTLIKTVEGETFIPSNKKFLVFYPSIDTEGKNVKRTEFEFVQPLLWQKSNQKKPDIKITHGSIEREETSPLISGTIENVGAFPSGPVELSVVVYDGRGDAIGVSRTYTDPISIRQKLDFGFTWPRPFKQTQAVCEVSSDVMLVIDRSGSMASISRTPPEPLSTVKDVAVSFVESLTSADQVGVVSFSNEASYPIDHVLSSRISDVTTAIERISIATTSAQNTNIGDGLRKAAEELLGGRAKSNSKKVIILLTDGDPTDPKMPGQNNYPVVFAEQSASDAKEKGISVFTIGLGSLVNNDLLSRLASSPQSYFNAPTSAQLLSIYKTISKNICVLKPNVIEIIAVP